MRQQTPVASSNTTHQDRSERGDFFTFKNAELILKDGLTFKAQQPAWQTKPVSGEVVFNTGMTGYIESLTDPSYAGQILTFTYPLIGNYGVIPQSRESSKIQVAGVIVAEVAQQFSHSQAASSLLAWLKSEDVPLLTDIDTRQLTKHLRKNGSSMGGFNITKAQAGLLKPVQYFISIDQPKLYNKQHRTRIILVDCGMKQNILRRLLEFPISIKRVPHDYDYSQEEFDGVFISNGPGDPVNYKKTVEIAQRAMKRRKPIFGICLGNQILALAAGAATYKLPFGHRGHNQPCIDPTTEQCVITSQNHGYAVDEASLPNGWRVLFRNLNDNSVEGIEHTKMPFFSAQFHPEAAPGPTDTGYLFERFVKSL